MARAFRNVWSNSRTGRSGLKTMDPTITQKALLETYRRNNEADDMLTSRRAGTICTQHIFPCAIFRKWPPARKSSRWSWRLTVNPYYRIGLERTRAIAYQYGHINKGTIRFVSNSCDKMVARLMVSVTPFANKWDVQCRMYDILCT